jgi:hypothetical protein
MTSRLNEPLIKSLFSALSLALSLSVFFSDASAQIPSGQPLPENLPISELKWPGPNELAPSKVATGKDLYCAGFISATSLPKNIQIIGAEEENTRVHLGAGDVIYLDAGRSQGVLYDKLYSIVRPMGDFHSPFAHTSGQRELGVYTRELGVVRVFAVQEQTATARIIFACDDVQLGDLLLPFEERRSPTSDISKPIPRYEPASGKKTGRIVLQREQREMLSPRDVVYIDLGQSNGVNVGDRFTIYRNYPDDAKVVRMNDDNVIQRRSGGYQSRTFKGGTFSNDHPREGRQEVKNERPRIPHKVVGELVVISVQGKSSTAIITRTTQEVHTGDWIEEQ